MFFVGILGVETKEEVIKDIYNTICKSCGRISTYRLMCQYNFFHLFFIPIYKWNKKYYLVSRCCDAVFEISEEYASRLQKEKDSVIDDSKLNEVKYGYNRFLCPNCKSVLYDDFNYCPHCGARLK
ncbi:hypothetical protein ABG79_00494 [Caloramator mitchellensis]|uniref:Zinc-ribbon 15 domain-containing protein n=1 Tax=Caloramator mitchellensis TaxID=908809 RepID=A0A0R3JZI6_CALMK|nr:zinc ribbon domain-containing protein [Caloramator mitchellensis]KRQ87693.1 hypothetical protein ABG79_00494 [Caloramator mitchellensis]